MGQENSVVKKEWVHSGSYEVVQSVPLDPRWQSCQVVRFPQLNDNNLLYVIKTIDPEKYEKSKFGFNADLLGQRMRSRHSLISAFLVISTNPRNPNWFDLVFEYSGNTLDTIATTRKITEPEVWQITDFLLRIGADFETGMDYFCDLRRRSILFFGSRMKLVNQYLNDDYLYQVVSCYLSGDQQKISAFHTGAIIKNAKLLGHFLLTVSLGQPDHSANTYFQMAPDTIKQRLTLVRQNFSEKLAAFIEVCIFNEQISFPKLKKLRLEIDPNASVATMNSSTTSAGGTRDSTEGSNFGTSTGQPRTNSAKMSIFDDDATTRYSLDERVELRMAGSPITGPNSNKSSPGANETVYQEKSGAQRQPPTQGNSPYVNNDSSQGQARQQPTTSGPQKANPLMTQYGNVNTTGSNPAQKQDPSGPRMNPDPRGHQEVSFSQQFSPQAGGAQPVASANAQPQQQNFTPGSVGNPSSAQPAQQTPTTDAKKQISQSGGPPAAGVQGRPSVGQKKIKKIYMKWVAETNGYQKTTEYEDGTVEVENLPGRGSLPGQLPVTPNPAPPTPSPTPLPQTGPISAGVRESIPGHSCFRIVLLPPREDPRMGRRILFDKHFPDVLPEVSAPVNQSPLVNGLRPSINSSQRQTIPGSNLVQPLPPLPIITSGSPNPYGSTFGLQQQIQQGGQGFSQGYPQQGSTAGYPQQGPPQSTPQGAQPGPQTASQGQPMRPSIPSGVSPGYNLVNIPPWTSGQPAPGGDQRVTQAYSPVNYPVYQGQPGNQPQPGQGQVPVNVSGVTAPPSRVQTTPTPNGSYQQSAAGTYSSGGGTYSSSSGSGPLSNQGSGPLSYTGMISTSGTGAAGSNASGNVIITHPQPVTREQPH